MSDDVQPAAAGPQCLLRGQFALFERADGGMDLFYDVTGTGQYERKTVPKAAVKMLQSKGPMAGMLRRVLGGEE